MTWSEIGNVDEVMEVVSARLPSLFESNQRFVDFFISRFVDNPSPPLSSRIYPLDMVTFKTELMRIIKKDLNLDESLKVNELFSEQYPYIFEKIVGNIATLERGRLAIRPNKIDDFLVLSRFLPLEHILGTLKASREAKDHHVHVGVIYTPLYVAFQTYYVSRLLSQRRVEFVFRRYIKLANDIMDIRFGLINFLSQCERCSRSINYEQYKHVCNDQRPNSVFECYSFEPLLMMDLMRSWMAGELGNEDKIKVLKYINLTSLWISLLVMNDIYRGLEIFAKFYKRSKVWSRFRGPPEERRVLVRRANKAFYINLPVFLNDMKIVPEAKLSARDMYEQKRFIEEIYRNSRIKFFLSYVKRMNGSGTRLSKFLNALREATVEARYFKRSLRYFYEKGIADIILGPDVAGVERAIPNWIGLLYVTSAVNTMQSFDDINNIQVSYHVGENYYNLINGLREVVEVSQALSENDRLGHGIALFDDDYDYSVPEDPYEALMDLALLYMTLVNKGRTDLAHKVNVAFTNVARHTKLKDAQPGTVHEVWKLLHNPSALLTAVESVFHNVSSINHEERLRLLDLLPTVGEFERLGIEPEHVSVDDHVLEALAHYLLDETEPIDLMDVLHKTMKRDEIVEAIELLRENVIEAIKLRRLRIEVCPTSNVLITNIDSLEKHPFLEFLRSGIDILVGSDDPSVLNTTIHVEEALLNSIRKKRLYRL